MSSSRIMYEYRSTIFQKLRYINLFMTLARRVICQVVYSRCKPDPKEVKTKTFLDGSQNIFMIDEELYRTTFIPTIYFFTAV